MKQQLNIWPVAVAVAVALCAGLLAVAGATGLWSGGELWSQLLAACMGAIVVAVVTMVLMRGQRASEEEKEKSIKIHESKVEVYSRFVARMYKLLADDEVSLCDFLGLRTEIYGSLIFYLADSNLRLILAEVATIDDYRDRTRMLETFARITRILQADLGTAHPEGSERTLVELWQRFDDIQRRHPASKGD